jgi:putative alpha-1,2-mannosidase
VWAGLGLFPVAGQSMFLVNAPSWREAAIDVGDNTLAVETVGFSEPEPDKPAQYVQALWLDGRPLDRSWLTGQEVHSGGRLLVELGPDPAMWRKAERPPSSRLPVPVEAAPVPTGGQA